MGRVPPLKPREVCRILESMGFVEVRQRGSHSQFRHADGRGTTVPIHAGSDISPVLLRQIAKDVGMTAEELLAQRWRRLSTLPFILSLGLLMCRGRRIAANP